MNDNYGDIKYNDFQKSTLDGLRDTAAKNLADEISSYRNESYSDAVEYVSRWYFWNYERRAWQPM